MMTPRRRLAPVPDLAPRQVDPVRAGEVLFIVDILDGNHRTLEQDLERTFASTKERVGVKSITKEGLVDARWLGADDEGGGFVLEVLDPSAHHRFSELGDRLGPILLLERLAPLTLLDLSKLLQGPASW